MIREDARSRPHIAAPPGRKRPKYHSAVMGAPSERRALMDAAFAQLQGRAEALARAAELVGRFRRERSPYAALALTTDTAILTAIANDYGYEEIFARQVRGLAQLGDVFIGFSTSGESENVLRAVQVCRECGVTVIAITGDRPNTLARLADIALRMPTLDTAATQELHMAVTHILCDIVESELAASAGGARA